MKLRDERCARCGWKYPGFHICVDLSVPVDPAILRKHYGFSQEKLDKMRSGVAARWERHREDMKDRDAKIVAQYKNNNISIKKLAEEYGIAYQTCAGILRRAESRGEVKVRPRGNNARWQERSA